MMVFAAPLAAAQLPGAPVIQNAWAAPGIVVALDIAGGSGTGVYAGAAGWAPASGRFQLSGGIGLQTITGAGSRAVYGVRGALPIMQLMSGKLGIAGFAGVGGGAGGSDDTLQTNLMVPAGIAVGYRQPIGTKGRGFSVFVDPNYQFHSGDAASQGLFRIGFGVDAGITSRFGITLGAESGANAARGKVGPRGSRWGVGASMKLGG
jgi:hypothetical protein